MILFIGPSTPNIEALSDKKRNSKIITNICHLDKNEEYDLYFIDSKINSFGLIKETEIILDELLMVFKINKIFYQNTNYDILKKYADYYGVEVYCL